MRFYSKLKVFFTSRGKHFHRITFSLHFNLWTWTAKTQPTGQCSSPPPPECQIQNVGHGIHGKSGVIGFTCDNLPQLLTISQLRGHTGRLALPRLCVSRETRRYRELRAIIKFLFLTAAPAFPLVSGQKLLFVLRFDKNLCVSFCVPSPFILTVLL